MHATYDAASILSMFVIVIVHFFRFLRLLFVVESRTEVQDGKYGKSDVVGDKGGSDPSSIIP